MRPCSWAVAVLGGLLCSMAAAAPQERLLDDFEAEPQSWKFIGGEEFPGAKGSLALDDAVAHGGKRSSRLQGDFRGGGAYVGVWRDLASLVVPDVSAFRVWVKAAGVTRLGVRITDSTGQCHQHNGVPLAVTDEWQEVVLKVAELVGGEHWGGANDGRWHPPAGGFGLNIGKDTVGDDQQGTLWLDDLRVDVVPPGVPALLGCTLSQPACRPAWGIPLTYRWDAVPMGRDYAAFVHIRTPEGKLLMQDDHGVPGGTAAWSGPVEYERTLVVPTDAPLGECRIIAGLWDSKGGLRLPVKPGDGATDVGEHACQIGTFRIAADAPLPRLGPPNLDLDGYHVTFDEDFSGPQLDVSAWGPGTRWIAHTPYGGDFGDARFADPTEGFPFTLADGILRIEARQTGDRWQSGLLSSVDPKGNGFSQRYGYFEMRAKLPKGLGTWPAFWLLGVPRLLDQTVDQIEIDVVEQYGVGPNALHTNVHLWHADGKHTAQGRPYLVPGMTDDLHTYGVRVEPDYLTFYYDRVELGRQPTPAAAKVPLYLLVDLALGGGWPIDQTPNPSVMEVDYVRAWSR